MAAAVGFWWERDRAGYEIDSAREAIVSGGGEAERYWVEGTSHRVFEDLANRRRTPEHALAFTRRWGFLLRRHVLQRAMSLTEVGGFYDQQRYVETLLTNALHKDYSTLLSNIPRPTRSVDDPNSGLILDVPDTSKVAGIGLFTLDVMMKPDSDLPHVFIRPASLLSFVVAEMVQTIAGAAAVRSCEHCHNLFTLSLKRRRTRRYCGTPCRVAANRAKADAEQKAATVAPKLRIVPPAPQSLPARRRRPGSPPD
jgi:hypothetical protein